MRDGHAFLQSPVRGEGVPVKETRGLSSAGRPECGPSWWGGGGCGLGEAVCAPQWRTGAGGLWGLRRTEGTEDRGQRMEDAGDGGLRGQRMEAPLWRGPGLSGPLALSTDPLPEAEPAQRGREQGGAQLLGPHI